MVNLSLLLPKSFAHIRLAFMKISNRFALALLPILSWTSQVPIPSIMILVPNRSLSLATTQEDDSFKSVSSAVICSRAGPGGVIRFCNCRRDQAFCPQLEAIRRACGPRPANRPIMGRKRAGPLPNPWGPVKPSGPRFSCRDRGSFRDCRVWALASLAGSGAAVTL